MTKYIVKCPYCSNAYTVEAEQGKDFTCPVCGGPNGPDCIEQEIDDTEKIQKAAREIVRKENEVKRLLSRETQRRQMTEEEQAIENWKRRQDLREADDSSTYEQRKKYEEAEQIYNLQEKVKIAVIGIVLALVVIFFLKEYQDYEQTKEEETTRNQRTEEMIYNIFLDQYNLKEEE